jgi:uncharacterized protein (DUF58 family)
MKPTVRGAACAIAGGLLLGLAMALRYPELAAVGAGALLAVATALAAVAVPPRVTLRRTPSADRVMRGEPVELRLEVTNRRRWGTLTATGDDGCQGPGDHRRTTPIAIDRLRAGSTRMISYGVPTARRGVLRLGPLAVGRLDPFGLARTRRTVGGAVEIRVYPRVHAMTLALTGWSRDPDGPAEQAPHGSVTFDKLREYVPGDDLRQVHWRTSARIGQLVVRERVDSSRPRLAVLLDDRATAHHGDSFEHACEAAASLLTAAERAGVGTHLLTPSGSQASTAYLDLLAELEPTGTGTLDGVAAHARQARAGDVLVCLTGRPSTADVAAVVGLREVYGRVAIATFDPAAALPRVSGVHAVAAGDGADFARLWPDIWRAP